MRNVKSFLSATFLLAAPVVLAPAWGQAFPAKPLRIIVTTPIGSAVDFLSRVVAQGLTETYKQQVIVDNRPGAGGLIGAGLIAQATPDGYTLGIASTAHVVSPLLQAKPPYRPLEDFTPVAMLTTMPSALVVSATVPVKSAQELVALARAKPGQLNFGSLGDGTAAHLTAEIFNRAARLKVVHVPFKSVADSYSALLAGDVHYIVYLVPSALPVTKGGKARALAVTGRARVAGIPDVPTMKEVGLPEAESEVLVGVVGPAGMPRDVVTRLNRDIADVLRRPDTRERYAVQGGVPTPEVTAESYGKLLKAEYEGYRRLLAELGLKPQ